MDRGTIRVLHVDDEPELLELTELYLERESDRVDVVSEADPERALTRLEETQIDCVISDYNMRTMNGIEFLEAVRAEYPELPFILFTGRGSEEVASEAISAGVTDYLQKESGTDQFAVLANRIENAISQYHAEQELEQTREYFSMILEHSSDFVMIVDKMGNVDYISPAVERVMGYTSEELLGDSAFDFTHPDDLAEASETLGEVLQNPGEEYTVEFRAQHKDGSWLWLEVRGRNLLNDPIIEGVMVNVRDITARKQREHDLEQQTERLRDLTRFLSHDLRNQLTTISGRIDIVEQEIDSEHLEAASQSVDRIEEMIEKVMLLAEYDQDAMEREAVHLASMAEQSMRTIGHETQSYVVEEDLQLLADAERFKTLLENLFLNAFDHGGEDVTVTVGVLADESGFFVEDDGQGIDAQIRERIFDSDFTTSQSETGFGLAIVKQIVEFHGWTLSITDSAAGGARFEFADVELPED
mgnify:CR=1 FL=1